MRSYPSADNALEYLCPTGPEVVTIEPTDHCNFSCPICVNRLFPQSKKGFMSLDLFDSIVERLPPGTRRINLFMGGEPLLHPDIGYFLRRLQAGPWALKMNTNGSLLASSRGEKLLEHPPDILVIGFDGESQEAYERFRGEGRFDSTREAVLKFLRAAKTARCKGQRIVQVIKEYEEKDGHPADLRDEFVLEMLSAGADDVRVEPLHDMNGRLRLPGYRYPPKPTGCSPCPKLVEELVIRWNGLVVACCCDHYYEGVVGSVGETDLLSCWHSREFVDFRRAHLEGRGSDLALCRTCDLCRGECRGPTPNRRHPGKKTKELT